MFYREEVFYFYFFIIAFYLFLGVLGLRSCTQTFSSSRDWELLSSCCIQASHCSDFSCCGTQALERTRLCNCGIWAQ